MGSIVYGPAGSGKTANAHRLADYLGYDRVFDNGYDKDGNVWNVGDPVPENALILTNDRNCGYDYELSELLEQLDAIEDLTRDLPSLIGSFEIKEFSIKDVIRGLRIHRYGHYLPKVIDVVLLSLGCEKKRVSYDSEYPYRYFNPASEVQVSMTELLERFVGTVNINDKFTINDANEFMIKQGAFFKGVPYEFIGKVLKKIGCKYRVTKTENGTQRYFMHPNSVG